MRSCLKVTCRGLKQQLATLEDTDQAALLVEAMAPSQHWTATGLLRTATVNFLEGFAYGICRSAMIKGQRSLSSRLRLPNPYICELNTELICSMTFSLSGRACHS